MTLNIRLRDGVINMTQILESFRSVEQPEEEKIENYVDLDIIDSIEGFLHFKSIHEADDDTDILTV